MNTKSKKRSSIFMICAVSIVGVFFLLFGLVAFNSVMYPYDIYLSQQVTLGVAQEVENQYLIQGKISNKGSEAVTIQSIEFWCYNADRTAHGTYTIENITLQPNSSYSIHEEIVGNGSLIYSSVSINSTKVEDADIILQYSEDGKNFGNKQNEITAMVFGGIMCCIAGVLIYKEIKKRKVLNG